MNNLTIKRHTTDTFTSTAGTDEALANFLTINITSQNTISTQNIPQNTTIQINVTIKCNSYSGSSCNTVSLYAQRNNSAITFTNIPTSTTTPMWTSNSNPQTCVLTAGNSCDISFKLNITGIKNYTTYSKITKYKFNFK